MEEFSIDEKYTQYIEKLISQVSEIVPEDVNELQKNYLQTNMRKSMKLLVSSFKDNEILKAQDFDEQCFYIQIIGEWSFHKEIDLFRSGIPAKYWKVVMNKIWYVMWEVIYACAQNDAPRETTLKMVERFIERSYNEAIEELREQSIINTEIEENAKGQSNIAKLAKEIQELETFKAKTKLLAKRIVFAILFGAIISVAIIKFKTIGLIIILTAIAVYYFIPEKNI